MGFQQVANFNKQFCFAGEDDAIFVLVSSTSTSCGEFLELVHGKHEDEVHNTCGDQEVQGSGDDLAEVDEGSLFTCSEVEAEAVGVCAADRSDQRVDQVVRK